MITLRRILLFIAVLSWLGLQNAQAKHVISECFAPDSNFTFVNSDSTECDTILSLDTEYDFVPVLKCSFDHPGIVTYSLPLFADIDGDGQTEVVVALEHSPNGFAVFDPNTCEAEHIVPLDGNIFLKDGGPVLGDVDNNGYVDIFIEVSTRIERWEYDPSSGQIVQRWATPSGVAFAERSHLDIWDINQDGQAEIIPNVGQMVNAVTGYVYPGTLPELDDEGKGLFAFTADAILGQAPEGQGNVELIYGTHIYRYDFMMENWILVSELPNIDWGFHANVALADMDLDGDVDAVMSNWDEIGQALIWDLQTDQILGGGVFDYPGGLGSRINISNIDTDPYPEMVMTCRFKVFAIDDIVSNGQLGSILWLDETSDESGHTQITSFDFDGNGTYEIAYRDETRLRIFSGLGTGIPTNGYPSGPRILLDSYEEGLCESFTGMEYPTIGDIDNDNQAEILSTCFGGINIYESGSLPWGNASKVWNTQAFNVTCVNPDGTIPAIPIENYTIYNNFLAQVNTNPEIDEVLVFLPDAFAQLSNIEHDCNGAMRVEAEICNQGNNQLHPSTPIALYWGNPTMEEAILIEVLTLGEELEIGNCTTITSDYYTPPSTDFNLFLVINDNGEQALPYHLNTTNSGGIFPINNIMECNYSNNMVDTSLQIGLHEELFVEASICEGESYEFGEQLLEESGEYSTQLISSSGCDSLINLTLTVLETVETITAATVCEGESYEFSGTSYTTSGTYFHTFNGINTCDSIAILELEVENFLLEELQAVICEGETYLFEGQELQTAGTYDVQYQTSDGCDSLLVLDLEVAPLYEHDFLVNICEGEIYTVGTAQIFLPGWYTFELNSIYGCDSIVHIDLEVHSPTEELIEQSICIGETYEFAGEELSITGNYIFETQSIYGCDSTVHLQLEVLEIQESLTQTTICEGENYEWNNQLYHESGNYEQILIAESGCDSIVYLELSIAPLYEEVVEHDLCSGESYFFNGQFLSETGTYEATFSSTEGCDSLVSLHLSSFPAYEFSILQEICGGESYSFAGQEFTETGSYPNVFQTIDGCDSIVTLELSVYPAYEYIFNEAICEGESYEFANVPLTEPGTYSQFLYTTDGCDSTLILHLEVNETSEILLQEYLCEGSVFELNGESYEAAGTYEQILQDSNGCDSLVLLELEVYENIVNSFEATICEHGFYIFNGLALTIPGLYEFTSTTENGCDSLTILNLVTSDLLEGSVEEIICPDGVITIGEETYETAGTYTQMLQTVDGCDSLLTIELTELPTDTSTTIVEICEGQNYVFQGVHLSLAGLYEFTLINEHGCDSILLLELETVNEFSVDQFEEICEGDEFLFGDLLLTESGTYELTQASSGGCDSTTTLALVVSERPMVEETASICDGSEYEWRGQILSTAGEYQEIAPSLEGCDTIFNFTLMVIENVETFLNNEICGGDTIFIGAEAYSNSGQFTQVFAASNGCDSLVHLDLSVLPAPSITFGASICEGETFLLNGEAFDEEGTFQQVYTAANGCDSMINIIIQTLPSYDFSVNATLCIGDSLFFADSYINQAGTYYETFATTLGCDSTVQLTVELGEIIVEELYAEICDTETYELNGQIYSEAGVYLDTIQTALGCDSIFELELEVHPTYYSTQDEFLCAGDSIELGGQVFNETGSYEITLQSTLGCDSVFLLQLEVETPIETILHEAICANENYEIGGILYSESGVYTAMLQNEDGCDSLVHLTLEVLPVYDFSQELILCEGDSILIGDDFISQSGSYEVHYQSTSSCDSIVNYLVEVEQEITIWGEDVSICEGESVQLAVFGADDINWLPTAGLSCNNCPNPIASPISTTNYSVTSIGCQGTPVEIFIRVEVNENPVVTAMGDQTITLGESADLEASGNWGDGLVSWLGPDGTICDNCERITVSPEQTSIYTAFAENEWGCTDADSVEIKVRRSCINDDVFVPNAFSPNGDGVNETFYVKAFRDIELKFLRIYDRWGALMFEGRTLEEHWDGTYKGQVLNPGVYMFYFQFVCPDGDEHQLMGNVTLLK